MSELPDTLPRHVAIIMDGNGRWAQQRSLPRVQGHEAGFETARRVTKLCLEWKIPILTLFAFSTENWSRPRQEVRFLMSRLRRFLKERREEFASKDVRLRAVGALEGLPEGVRTELERTVERTQGGKAMTLVLALNYGGRREIADAARAIARRVKAGELDPESVDERAFAEHLYAADLPDVDLMIRTGGEMRVSNFLLWELWYAELYVTDAYWPDFGEQDLLAALNEYARRERRFGRVRAGAGSAAGSALRD